MAHCQHEGCSMEMIDYRAWTLGVQELQISASSEAPDPDVAYNHARCRLHRQDLAGNGYQLDKVRACLDHVRRDRNRRHAAWKRDKARRAQGGGAFRGQNHSSLRE